MCNYRTTWKSIENGNYCENGSSIIDIENEKLDYEKLDLLV
jgi:hypothetical protein